MEDDERALALINSIAAAMEGMRLVSRKLEEVSTKLDELESAMNSKEALKATSSYPVASGAFDEEICSMHARGFSDKAIGEALGVAPSTVGNRRRALGVANHTRWLRWTEREDARLRAAMPKCSTFGQVAEHVPGRGASACRARAKKLGLSMRARHRRWTEEEDQLLRNHWKDASRTSQSLASELGRTVNALQTRAYVLGLTKGHERQSIVSKRNREMFWKGDAGNGKR